MAISGYAEVFSFFMERLTGRVPLIINGNGLQTRDFVHVSDVSEGVWLALNSGSEGVFNVASGKQVRNRELAEVMARLRNIEEPVSVFRSTRKGGICNSYGDYSNARKRLSYLARKNLLEGLGELLEDIEVAEVLN